MKQSTYNKPIIIIFIVALVAGVYFWFVRDTETPAVETLAVEEQSIIGRDIVNALSALKNVNLESSLFQDTSFKSLKDFNLRIQKQEIGRTNPLAPFSRSSEDVVVTRPTNAF